MNRLLTDNELTINDDVTYNDITRKHAHTREYYYLNAHPCTGHRLNGFNLLGQGG